MNNPNHTVSAMFAAAPRADDFPSVVNLLAVLGEAERQLGALQLSVENDYARLVDDQRAVYGTLQSTISEAEAALEVIARRNPQWFDDKKHVSTPYGVVKFKSSKEIVTADENISIQLIEAHGKGDTLLRTVKVLNLQALAELSDAELANFALIRKLKENLTIDTQVVDLGKAVKAAEKTPGKAAKAARKAAAAVGAACVALLFFCGAPHAQAASIYTRFLPAAPKPAVIAPAPSAPAPSVAPATPVAAPAPAPTLNSQPSTLNLPPAPAPDFPPLSKAELIRSLERNRDNAQLLLDIIVLGGNSPDSAPAREQRGRLSAFNTALELADLLP